MKVLIVKASALGDVVHALPVLAYLQSADPAIEIDWLIEEQFAPLLTEHPLIRRVHLLSTRTWRQQSPTDGIAAVAALVRRLRGERYDLVLDLQGNAKSGLFTWLTGAPRRYGFSRAWVRELPNLLATNRRVSPDGPLCHISDKSLAVAVAAVHGGTEKPTAGPLPIPDQIRDKVQALLREKGVCRRPLVVLHYGTTWDTKLWSLDHWCRLAQALCRGDLRCLLTWGNEAEFTAANVIRNAAGDNAALWPRASLMELAALLASADLVVGGDTGPIHIAAAVGTPTVSFYRATDAARNGPRGEKHRLLQAPFDCSPCLRKNCDQDLDCAHSVSVEAVLDAVVQLLPAAGINR
jgi:heptosyltransferase-1